MKKGEPMHREEAMHHFQSQLWFGSTVKFKVEWMGIIDGKHEIAIHCNAPKSKRLDFEPPSGWRVKRVCLTRPVTILFSQS